jgi:hypothetical protein
MFRNTEREFTVKVDRIVNPFHLVHLLRRLGRVKIQTVTGDKGTEVNVQSEEIRDKLIDVFDRAGYNILERPDAAPEPTGKKEEITKPQGQELPADPEAPPENKHGHMGNFYLNMPVEEFRQNNGKSDERIRLYEAIDGLLREEFPKINGAEIALTLQELNQEICRLLDTKIQPGAGRPGQEETAALQFLQGRRTRVYEKLRPLFNRVIKSGFDPLYLVK